MPQMQKNKDLREPKIPKSKETNDKEPFKAEFDEFCQNYRKIVDENLWVSGETSEYFAEYKVRMLCEWFPEKINQNLKILDFGCGDGLMTEYIKRYFMYSKIYGADISQKSIIQARESFRGIDFSVIDGSYLPFEEREFDLVVAAGVFHHIQPIDQKPWVEEIHRVLKPGGTIVIFELNPLNLGTLYIFRNHPMEKNAKMLFPWRVEKLLSSFTQTTIKFYCFFPNWMKFLRPIERFISWLPLSGLYAGIARKN